VNLIVFPPSLLVVELFRRSRRYTERKEKIFHVLEENENKRKETLNKDDSL
jgi:hypothetical protein